MKWVSKITLLRCLSLSALVWLMALAGPSLIHLGYRAVTQRSVKEAKAERYQSLANAEVSDSTLFEAQRLVMRNERLRLYYWFHARGWNIDEDGESKSLLQPWRELIRYWTDS